MKKFVRLDSDVIKYPRFDLLKGDEPSLTYEALYRRQLLIKMIGDINMIGITEPELVNVPLKQVVERLFINLPLAVHKLNIHITGFDGPFSYSREGNVAEESNCIELDHNPLDLEHDSLLGFSEYLPSIGESVGLR